MTHGYQCHNLSVMLVSAKSKRVMKVDGLVECKRMSCWCRVHCANPSHMGKFRSLETNVRLFNDQRAAAG